MSKRREPAVGLAADGSEREYQSLNEALSAWQPTVGRRDAWEEIEKVIGHLMSLVGNITRIHIPASESYVAVTFGGRPDRVGAYVAVGHIDHIVEIPGSFVLDASPSYWRTPLKKYTSPTNDRGSKIVVAKEKCPNCSIWISVYAECTCGWTPGSGS